MVRLECIRIAGEGRAALCLHDDETRASPEKVTEAPRDIEGRGVSLAGAQAKPEPFQARVDPWLMACFGLEIARDILERNHRFLEEAIELVQANGCTVSEAHQLVDYVYGRDQGEINQEVGGVMVTLAALCLASGVDMHAAAETELSRVWTKVEKIRAKHFAKPKFSPLPGYSLPSTQENPPLVRRSEADAYFKILQTIARFPITDPKNMDAVNMRLIAEGALAVSATDRGGK